MNWKRAALAAGAGAIGVVVIFAGLYAALLIAFYNWSPIGGGDPSVDVVQLLLFLTIPPALFCAGGAIPARALGVRWSRSLALALVAHVIAIFVLIMMLRWEPFDDLRSYIATPFVSAAALTILLAARYSSIPASPRVAAAIIAAATFLILLTLLFPHPTIAIAIALLSWLSLPTLAGLMLPRSPDRASS